MKKIFIATAYFIPGSKGGGPIQSIKNMVESLSDELEFYILTADRDWKEKKAYSNIHADNWIQFKKNIKVFYTNPKTLTLFKLRRILNDIPYDILYLNSFFSFRFSIQVVLLKKFRLIESRPIIIAPRGEFSKGALRLKNIKKILFINIVKISRLYSALTWHATAEPEKMDIKNIFGHNAIIKIAGNLTSDYNCFAYDKCTEKKTGKLKIVFVSRVHPKKNLKTAINILGRLNGIIEFNIYGSLEDKRYWAECEKEIKRLPQCVKVAYKGSIEHHKIFDIFKKHHVFFFPTLGENYGHVISEALISGCPVIISDQTPWRHLDEFHVGMDISLKDENKFVEVLQGYVDMTQDQYIFLSKKAFEYGKQVSNKSEKILCLLSLFELNK